MLFPIVSHHECGWNWRRHEGQSYGQGMCCDSEGRRGAHSRKHCWVDRATVVFRRRGPSARIWHFQSVTNRRGRENGRAAARVHPREKTRVDGARSRVPARARTDNNNGGGSVDDDNTQEDEISNAYRVARGSYGATVWAYFGSHPSYRQCLDKARPTCDTRNISRRATVGLCVWVPGANGAQFCRWAGPHRRPTHPSHNYGGCFRRWARGLSRGPRDFWATRSNLSIAGRDGKRLQSHTRLKL